jgi:proteasome lid subunit RPN8/RPN11
MVAHARGQYPKEACGLLICADGDTHHPTELLEVTNVSPQPEYFFIFDSDELIAAVMRMDATGKDIAAVYHSHPVTAAIPSAADVQFAMLPNCHYIIVSLEDGRDAEPDIRTWTIEHAVAVVMEDTVIVP